MRTVLAGKTIVLGVTGSIAAYKAADLASRLVQAGATVQPVLTPSAARLISPLTFQAIAHHRVATDLFDPSSELSMDHVALASRADAVVVAPATANTVARLANGLADDAITATVLATDAPVLVAPAGDAHMFQKEVTRANLQKLRDLGFTVVGPMQGRLASGMTGTGRLEEPARLVEHIRVLLGASGDYAGRKVVVSAGGTQEPIDPVRIITNRSSGKMGFAMAEAARDRGARVVLVTAPTSLPDPVGVNTVHVRTSDEMREAILPECDDADLLVMAAAIADFRVKDPAGDKIKKDGSGALTLTLVPNEDWMPTAKGRRLIKVAFAAETSDLLSNARAKLAPKGASLVVANDVSREGIGFGADANAVTILDAEGGHEEVEVSSKFEVAQRILDRARPLLKE